MTVNEMINSLAALRDSGKGNYAVIMECADGMALAKEVKDIEIVVDDYWSVRGIHHKSEAVMIGA